MRRLSLVAAIVVAVILGLMATSVDAATAPHYTRHPTTIASTANNACPSGYKKSFRVVGKLASGQKFVSVGRFYIRLTNGSTVASPTSKIFRLSDRTYEWYVPVARTAKIDSRKYLSHVVFTATGGATWTGTVYKYCYT